MPSEQRILRAVFVVEELRSDVEAAILANGLAHVPGVRNVTIEMEWREVTIESMVDMTEHVLLAIQRAGLLGRRVS